MRRSTATLAAAAAICVLTAGCASTGNAESMTPTRTLIPRPPLVERELASLLLTPPEEINAAMGTTGMAVTGSSP